MLVICCAENPLKKSSDYHYYCCHPGLLAALLGPMLGGSDGVYKGNIIRVRR